MCVAHPPTHPLFPVTFLTHTLASLITGKADSRCSLHPLYTGDPPNFKVHLTSTCYLAGRYRGFAVPISTLAPLVQPIVEIRHSQVLRKSAPRNSHQWLIGSHALIICPSESNSVKIDREALHHTCPPVYECMSVHSNEISPIRKHTACALVFVPCT